MMIISFLGFIVFSLIVAVVLYAITHSGAY